MNDTATKLYNKQLEQLDDECNELSNIKKEFYSKYDAEGLFLKDFNYSDWFVSQLESDRKAIIKHVSTRIGRGRSKRIKRIKNLNSKQNINQISSFIRRNKSWK